MTSFSQTIRSNGYISTVKMSGSHANRKGNEYSKEDYVARITTLFLPYMHKTISEHEFSMLQASLSSLITEIRKRDALSA